MGLYAKLNNEVTIHITLDNTQNLAPKRLEAFERELNRRIKNTFPSSEFIVKKVL